MHRLKEIKERLVESIEGQMDNLACVNTKELGEVVDMVKDLEEAMYYCCKIKMMCEEREKEGRPPLYETRTTSTSSTTIG